MRPSDPVPPAPTSAAPRAELPPLEVDTPPVTEEADRICPGLIGGLPLLLGDAPARPVRSASPYAYAWGDPPVVLRCGVPRPAALAPDSVLSVISGVTWFPEPGAEVTRWTTVDRALYVEVTAPADRAAGPVALLATTLAERVPALSGPSSSPTPTR